MSGPGPQVDATQASRSKQTTPTETASETASETPSPSLYEQFGMSTMASALQGESMDGVGPHITGQIDNAHRSVNELPTGPLPEQATNAELLSHLNGGASCGIDDPSGNGALEDWLPIWVSELADEPGFTELLPSVGIDEGACEPRSRQAAILEARVAGESGKIGHYAFEPTFEHQPGVARADVDLGFGEHWGDRTSQYGTASRVHQNGLVTTDGWLVENNLVQDFTPVENWTDVYGPGLESLSPEDTIRAFDLAMRDNTLQMLTEAEDLLPIMERDHIRGSIVAQRVLAEREAHKRRTKPLRDKLLMSAQAGVASPQTVEERMHAELDAMNAEHAAMEAAMFSHYPLLRNASSDTLATVGGTDVKARRSALGDESDRTRDALSAARQDVRDDPDGLWERREAVANTLEKLGISKDDPKTAARYKEIMEKHQGDAEFSSNCDNAASTAATGLAAVALVVAIMEPSPVGEAILLASAAGSTGLGTYEAVFKPTVTHPTVQCIKPARAHQS